MERTMEYSYRQVSLVSVQSWFWYMCCSGEWLITSIFVTRQSSLTVTLNMVRAKSCSRLQFNAGCKHFCRSRSFHESAQLSLLELCIMILSFSWNWDLTRSNGIMLLPNRHLLIMMILDMAGSLVSIVVLCWVAILANHSGPISFLIESDKFYQFWTMRCWSSRALKTLDRLYWCFWRIWN